MDWEGGGGCGSFDEGAKRQKKRGAGASYIGEGGGITPSVQSVGRGGWRGE